MEVGKKIVNKPTISTDCIPFPPNSIHSIQTEHKLTVVKDLTDQYSARGAIAKKKNSVRNLDINNFIFVI